MRRKEVVGVSILVVLLRVEMLYNGGMSLREACKKTGISVHTYYKYRKENQQGTVEEKNLVGAIDVNE